MTTITIRLNAIEFFTAVVEIRDWLDCNRYQPVRFKYDQEDDNVVLSVDFETEAAAAAFAKRFDCSGNNHWSRKASDQA